MDNTASDQTTQNQAGDQGNQQAQNPAERRINQLFARAKTAEERVGELENSQQDLQTKFLELQQENAMLRGQQGSVAPPPPAAGGDPLAGLGNQQGSVQPDPVASLRKDFQDAIGSLRQELQVNRAVEQLKTSQQQALGMAVREFPMLQDPQSQMYKLTEQIMTNDNDLRTHSLGPYKAALMAAGILGVQQTSQQSVSDGQRAAATAPMGGGSAVDAGGKQAKIQELEGQIKELTEKLRTGQGDVGALWGRLRVAKLRHGKLTGANVGELPHGYEKYEIQV